MVVSLAAGVPSAFTGPVKVSLIRKEEKNYLVNAGENTRVSTVCNFARLM